MRIIKNKTLQKLASLHPTTRPTVAAWKKVITATQFTNFVQLRKAFPHADQITTKSKRTVTVFNIKNQYRLITAIHYNRKLVFILRLLSHADYDKNTWKSEL